MLKLTLLKLSLIIVLLLSHAVQSEYQQQDQVSVVCKSPASGCEWHVGNAWMGMGIGCKMFQATHPRNKMYIQLTLTNYPLSNMKPVLTIMSIRNGDSWQDVGSVLHVTHKHGAELSTDGGRLVLKSPHNSSITIPLTLHVCDIDFLDWFGVRLSGGDVWAPKVIALELYGEDRKQKDAINYSLVNMSIDHNHAHWELKIPVSATASLNLQDYQHQERYKRYKSTDCMKIIKLMCLVPGNKSDSCNCIAPICRSEKSNCENPTCFNSSSIIERENINDDLTCICLTNLSSTVTAPTADAVCTLVSVPDSTEPTSTTPVVTDSTEPASTTPAVTDSMEPASTTDSVQHITDSTAFLTTSITDGNNINAEQIKETNMAIQRLFSAVNMDMEFDVLASSRLLYSVATADFISELLINDTELLRTFDSLFNSITSVENVAVSELLRSLNIFALLVMDEGFYAREQFRLNISLVPTLSRVDGISYQDNTINLSPEVLSVPGTANVRVASFLYTNLNEVLVSDFNGHEASETRVVSPVISSALRCGDTLCDTSSIQALDPVQIQLQHGVDIVSDEQLNCVFWNIILNDSGSVIGGAWNDSGCKLIESTSDFSICECDHLTNFAILLSPRLQNISAANAIALNVIGKLGVCVSLIALAATVLILICLKSMWSMRTYIHIHLSITLMVSQVIFVAGVDKTSNKAACALVAVLLHYFYMVTAMWMLMEGVVLYIVLVKVFIEKSKRNYLFLFTVLSYGIPLLYMCLTLPLGFMLQDKQNYGYESACWLNFSNHFIWTFIVPILVIIMINIGFFVMVIVIMCKQRYKLHVTESKFANLQHWLRSSISLIVIMGLTWFVGILFFDNDLITFAYIITIFLAFQGLAIFCLFILASKKVQAAFLEWLRKRINNSWLSESHFGDAVNSWVNKSRESANPEIVMHKKDRTHLNEGHFVKDSEAKGASICIMDNPEDEKYSTTPSSSTL